jgi:hypothetical protein
MPPFIPLDGPETSAEQPAKLYATTPFQTYTIYTQRQGIWHDEQTQ